MENNSMINIEVDEFTREKMQVMRNLTEAHLNLCRAMNIPSVEIRDCIFNSDSKYGVTVAKKKINKEKGK